MMPVVAFGQSAWISDILDALEIQAAKVSGLPRDRVFSYLGKPEDFLKFPPAERFAVINPGNMPVDSRIVAGGGAAQTAFDGEFLLNIFARLGTDREMQSVQLLRDKQAGLAEQVRKLAVALQVFAPVDAASTCLFREPCRITGIRWNPRTPPTGWAWAELSLSVKFRTDLTSI